MVTFRYIREQIWPLLLTLKIEPYVFIFFLSTSISEITSTQLIQDKICLFKYNRSAIYCAQIDNEKSDSAEDSIKSEILSDLAQYVIYRTIIASLPSILLSLFIGSWTDKYIHGRKILLCLVSLGYAAQFALLLWNAIKFELDVYYILIAYIPSALTGNWIFMILAAYSYVSKNSSKKYRIIKLAIFEISVFTANPLGTYIGGQLLGNGYLRPSGQLYNYVTVFTISIIGLITAFFWVLFVINEKKSDYNENRRLINSDEEQFKSDVEKSEEQIQEISSDDKLAMLRVFDFDNVKEVLRTCFKSRPNRGRAQIWLLYLSMCAFMISDVKNSPALFPYVEEVFDWNAQQFSTIKSIASIASIISFAVIVPTLSGLFKVNDTKLGIIGITAMFFASLALGSLVSPTGLYLCYAFNAATGSSSIAIRSLLSKIVSETEIGKVYSLLAAIETVVPSISSIFYNTLFRYTIDFYPSLCFQVAAALLFYPLIVFIWIDMTRIQFY